MKAKVLHLKNYIKINEKIPILIRKNSVLDCCVRTLSMI